MKDNGLINYPPFYLIFRIGLFVAAVSVVFLYYNEVRNNGLFFCGTKQCFLNFIDIYAFPIEILKATIALLAIVALLHKSNETQKQILISKSQNNFSNYFKHKEELKKSIDANLIGGIKCDTDLLHKKIFQSAIDGDYSVSKEALTEIEVLIVNLMKSIINNTQKIGFNDEMREIFPSTSIEDDKNLYSIYDYLHCHNYGNIGFQRVINCNSIADIQNYKLVIEQLVNMLNLLKVIVIFDHTKRSDTSVDVFFASFYAKKVMSEINALYSEILKFDPIKVELVVNIGDKSQTYVFERLMDIFSENFVIDFEY